ncbi:CLIP domain-containing serine protease B9-like [Drosophila gunungcola]|uniref:CLIP domain-containing serine protease B9-like n=1 Tax=Drosophila gunungcola TaxID=103775 RepID=UPI0022DF25D4|nr:CLIP domain-containing serine protease B9-like [Drosophila gunungcola]
MMLSAGWIALCTLLLFKNGLAIFLEQNCGKVFANQTSGSREPWLATILTKTERKFICSGTLINRHYVLTTATCLENQLELIVCLGKCDANVDRDTEVTTRITHISYSANSHVNDIGLIYLFPDVEYKSHIKPICILLDPEQIWPKSNFDSTLWSGIEYKTSFVNSTCSGPPCKAIGKPLSLPNDDGLFVLQGILSFRDHRTNAYVYTKVFAFSEWLVANVLDVDILLR